MTTTGIKFDDGSGGFATNCFPVRGLMRFGEDDSGAWVVAQKAEQRRRFKAVLCTKPRDFESIRQERKRSEKEGTAIIPPTLYPEDTEDDVKVLDGFFLMKHCCVDDPVDLCSVNISGQGFCDVKQEDFQLFDNVAYVNAAENFLPLECFNSFPILRELEMPLNGLRGIKMKLGEFMNLELLDLSYNNLSPDDVLPLGLLPNLKVLHLTGNGLNKLPPDMAHPHVEQMKHGNRRIQRFPNLEILLLDDNKLADLSTFAGLAGLRKLKHLNLSKNEMYSVPQLMLVEGRHITQEFDEGLRSRGGKTPKSGGGKSSRRSSRRSARRSARSAKSREISIVGSQTGQHGDTVVPAEFLSEVKDMVKDDGGVKMTDSKGQESGKRGATEKELSSLSQVSEGQRQVSHISDSISQSQKEGSIPEGAIKIPNAGQENADTSTGAAMDSTVVGDTTKQEAQPLEENAQDKPSVDSLLDLDDMLEELNLDKIDEKVEKDIEIEKEQAEEERKKEDMMSRMSSGFDEYGEDGDVPLPPPFPELRYLNLSHNLIEEEEGLLAVAAWPMLTELVIHDNPLTKERTGDPPLLKRFLHDRLGIQIERKKPGPLQKPHIEVTQHPSRMVKSKVPPVPRCDVDALLALEYNKEPSSEMTSTASSSSVSIDQAGFESPSKPLPPIQQTTLDTGGMIIEEEDEDYDDDDFDDGDDCQEEDPSKSADMNEDGDAFFMTAVDDQQPEEPIKASSEKSSKKKKKKKKPKAVDKRYEGYEDLLEIDESQVTDGVPTPKDISGNIRALQYALNHPLVFRENRVYLDRPQKPFQPYVRTGPKESKPRKPRSLVVEEALTFLKERRTIEEESLKNVLARPKQYKRHFHEAPDLLQQVQHRYNKVRARSVKEQRNVQNIIRETLSEVDDQSKKSQLLVNS